MINISFTGKGVGPFRLKMVSPEVFQIHSVTNAFEGNKTVILDKAVSLGVRPEDLSVAVEEMAKKDHNCAEFGVAGRFLYTKKENREVA